MIQAIIVKDFTAQGNTIREAAMVCRRLFCLLFLLGLLTVLSGCHKAQPAETASTEQTLPQEEDKDFVLNTGSKKFHLPECEYAKNMQEENRVPYLGKRWLLIQDGFSPCKSCNP